MKWPWSRGGTEEVQKVERGTIATASVKAQAQVVVDEIRSNLDRLETILEGESDRT